MIKFFAIFLVFIIFQSFQADAQLFRYKKHINLQIYSNVSTIIDDASRENNNITYICDDNKAYGCDCDDGHVICMGDLKSANIKPVNEEYVIKSVHFMWPKITALTAGQIMPDNEGTIVTFEIYKTDLVVIGDGAFDAFSSLQFLRLIDANLNDIGENVLTLKLGESLHDLNLGHNKFSILNAQIFQHLHQLTHLSFVENSLLHSIEGVFPESMANLEVLDLSFCAFAELDENVFVNLRNLEEINFVSNNFNSIPSAISSLSKLKSFYFGGNDMSIISRNAFAKNTKLEILDFKHSYKLDVIEDCAFCNLYNLKKINLMFSRSLSYIDENAFGGVTDYSPTKLTVFCIERCNISVLPEKLLNWENVEFLAINNNPFACNCSNAWLFNDLMSDSSIFEDKLASFFDIFGKPLHHHKFRLGCLGAPISYLNQTHHPSVAEIFKPCKTGTFLSTFLWGMTIFAIFVGMGIAAGIYVFRSRKEKLEISYVNQDFILEDSENVIRNNNM